MKSSGVKFVKDTKCQAELVPTLHNDCQQPVGRPSQPRAPPVAVEGLSGQTGHY